MKKIVLIATVLLSCINLNAQDATNDATWEETIGFIKKHLDKIDRFSADHEIFDNAPFLKLEITDNGYLDTARKDRGAKYDVRFDLSLLSTISYYHHYIELTFSKTTELTASIIYRSLNSSSGLRWKKYSTSAKDIKLYYNDDSELNPRIAKAWKHLAYLATKKREEARKASGDKF